MISRFYKPALLACLLAISHPGLGQEDAEDNTANPQALVATSLGEIRIELFQDKAPNTVANFIQYANDGFYTDTVFHRVIAGFMIQAGGFTADMAKKPTRDAIGNEADNGLANDRGTIAMARTPNPHSATSQFFINVENNPSLNHSGKESSRAWGYTVFGRVVDGMDVVDKIRGVETGVHLPHRDVPKTPVVITGVSIED